MRLLLLPLFGLAGACGGGSPGTVVGVAPVTVPNILPRSTTGDNITGANVTDNQGSTHVFTVGSTQPKPCVSALTGTFNVNITTPLGLSTTYPFTLTFTCP